ncbi:polymerase delta-interacting protein 3 [Callorhinchus milii]|uniref:Polymerase delta-interacting protein 3 n=1 Tax=Callorhinchus milii TaxID=7868 RepID=V9KVG1_CALMI|nr:polymerase delta-interacting protein 3 [Callorhinchus milii]
MADISLDEIIRKRGLRVKGRPAPSVRPLIGGIKSRIGDQRLGVGTGRPLTGFQRTFDARQKIGLTDARQRLTVRDARERLDQKDARSKITGATAKVLDARQMINSRKGQDGSGQGAQPKHQLDARQRLGARRTTPAPITPLLGGTVGNRGRITKTIQQKLMTPVLSHPPLAMRINVVNIQSPSQTLDEIEDEEEEEEELLPVTKKVMKISTGKNHVTPQSPQYEMNWPLQNIEPGSHNLSQAIRERCRIQPGLSVSKLSLGKTPLTKVVQNDSYTAPAPLPAPVPAPLTVSRFKHLTNISRTATLSLGEDTEEDLPPAEPVLSPLEGTKMTVNNLHTRVTEEDIVELFCVCGALKRARLVRPGVAEVVFVRKDDAITAYKKYNNRCLDGQPMKCNLHMNGNVITSEQPILLRLSDAPVTKVPEMVRPRVRQASHPQAEVDPDTVLKALFKSCSPSTSAQPTAFKIKL